MPDDEAGGIHVGSASVDIVPDARKFRAEMDAKLRDLTAPIRLVINDKAFDVELRKLTRTREAIIKAKVDDAAAKADLDRLARNRRVDVKVNDGGSVGKIERQVSGLTAAVVGLGPALIPIAAAGVGAFAGLGVAIGAAAAGAGTLYLAFTHLDQSRAGQAFSARLETIKTQLTGLRRLAQTNVLPGVDVAIAGAMRNLPAFQGLVASTSRELGSLAAEAGQALSSPFWQNFFRFLETQAGPDLILLGHSLGNVAKGFAGLAVAFAPVATQVGVGIEKLTARFAAFGAQATSNSGFQHFLLYVQTQGPIVVRFLGDLAHAAGLIVQALAPFGGVALAVIEGLDRLVAIPVLQFFTSLPGPVQALAVALGAFFLLRPKFAGMASSVDGLGNALTRLKERAQIQAALGAAGGATVSKFGAGMAAAKVQTSALVKGAGGLLGVLGGPWGIALTGATALITLFAARHQAAQQRVHALTDQLIKEGGAATEAGRATLAKNLIDAKAGQAASQLGLNLGDLTQALVGNKQGFDDQIASLNATIAAGTRWQAAGKGVVVQTTDQAKAATVLRDALLEQRKSVDASSQSLDAARSKYDQLRALGFSAAQANAQLGTSFIDVSGKASTATISLDQLNTAVGQLLDKFITIPQARANMIGAIDAITKKVVEAKGAFVGNTSAINLNTTAGRNLQAAVITAASGVKDLSQKVLEQTGSQDKANAAWNTGRARLIAHLEAMGLSATKAGELADKYGLVKNAVRDIPNSKTVVFKTVGLGGALVQVESYATILSRLGGNVITTSFQVKRENIAAGATGGKVWDGAIHRDFGGAVFGAGTATSDSIRAYLSNGEFVLRTAAAKAIGYDKLAWINALGSKAATAFSPSIGRSFTPTSASAFAGSRVPPITFTGPVGLSPDQVARATTTRWQNVLAVVDI